MYLPSPVSAWDVGLNFAGLKSRFYVNCISIFAHPLAATLCMKLDGMLPGVILSRTEEGD